MNYDDDDECLGFCMTVGLSAIPFNMYMYSVSLVKPVDVHSTCCQVKTWTSSLKCSVSPFVPWTYELWRTSSEAPRTEINIGITTKMRELCGTMCVYNASFIVF